MSHKLPTPKVHKRILYIEDDDALGRVIQLRLRRLGFEVVIASDGPTGLDLIRREPFDLTLLDYKLPGMDGLEVMRTLAANPPFPPVVVLSGSNDLNVAVQAMKLGASDYVIKEVDRGYFELLESTLARCLEKQAMQEDMRQAERHLAETSGQLQTTLTNINEGLSVYDEHLCLQVFNDQFARLYDFPSDLVRQGTTLGEFIVWRYEQGELGDDPQDQVVAREVAGAVPRTTRIYEVHRPGGKVIEVRANPMPGGGFVSTHTDITSRKRNEEALRESQDRYRRLSEFASSVIHNVGNILSSINVSCGSIYRGTQQSKIKQLHKIVNLLKSGIDIPNFLSDHPKGQLLPDYMSRLAEVLVQEQGDTLEEVQSVLKNLMLITQIIEYQQSQGKRDEVVEVVSLDQIVEDAVKVKTDAILREGIEVVKKIEALTVNGQKAKLTHVMINLVKNAIEAMADVSERQRVLTIESAYDEQGQTTLSISDTGSGLSPEQKANLFTHGFTTKANGHGFGLHYCANAMDEMGNRIEAFSEGEGKGATFKLIFRKRSEAVMPGSDRFGSSGFDGDTAGP